MSGERKEPAPGETRTEPGRSVSVGAHGPVEATAVFPLLKPLLRWPVLSIGCITVFDFVSTSPLQEASEL